MNNNALHTELLQNELKTKLFQQSALFFEKFPIKNDDEALIYLKAHLLVEQLLIAIVSKKVKHPKMINEYKYKQYLCLNRAFDDNIHSWVWSACDMLNSIRNKLAHSLEPTGLEKSQEKFLNIIEKNAKTGNMDEALNNLLIKFGKLKTYIFLLYLHLAGKSL